MKTALDGLAVQNFHPILPSPDLFYYRNKMEFSFGDSFDRSVLKLDAAPGSVHVGLHPKGRFAITAPTPECQLISKEANLITQTTAAWATEHSIPVYVRPKNSGVLRHLVIREGKNTGERLVTLVASSGLAHVEDLCLRLKKLNCITSFVVAQHDGLSDIARGSSLDIMWGPGWIKEKVGRVEFRVTPYAFMQTNTRAAETMIELLRTWAGYGDTLLDLYCGTGTIGLNLADVFISVRGMECEPESVANAVETAERNGINNAAFESGRVEKMLDKFPHERSQTVCIVDPPRAGLHPDVANALIKAGFPSLIYVSCNPLTLARDLKKLEAVYAIEDVQPLDFFPHTDHVETMVKLHAR